MGKSKGPSAPPIPEWVLTYGDMMSLLLCFFILLAAFSEPKKPKEIQKLIEAIREAFGVELGSADEAGEDGVGSVSRILDELDIKTERTTSEPAQDPNTPGPRPMTQAIHEGTRFLIGAAIIFPAGSAELSAEAQRMLQSQVAPKIKGKSNRFEIRGHAFGVEDLAGGSDPLRLSFERAMAVREYLVDGCGVDARTLAVQGFGDTEPLALRGDLSVNRRAVVLETEVGPSQRSPDYHFSGGTGR